jgi:hypothetical protein
MDEKSLVSLTVERLEKHGWTTEQEWYPVQKRSQFGTGDILAIKDHCLLAVECKMINRTNPTQKRKKVKDQALLYASYAKIRHPDKRVRGCWITNEKKEYTCDILYDDAIQTVAAYVDKKGLLRGFNPIDRQKVADFLNIELIKHPSKIYLS